MDDGVASDRTSVKSLSSAMRVAPLIVAIAIGVATVAGCGKSFFANVSASTATATPSPGTGAFLYVSNYNDAKISEFARNTSTGKLTLKGTVAAGATQGPKGMAIDPSNSYLYAANFSDGNVYEFSIQSDGTLGVIGHVASGVQPEMVAVGPSGQYVYVTNFNNGAVGGSIYEYSIGSSGSLSQIGSVVGPSGPLGIAVGPNGSYLYVAGNAGGYIWTYTINSNGTLTQSGLPVQSLGTTRGTPGLITIAADSTATYMFVTDVGLGAVSEFTIGVGGTPVFGGTFTTGSTANQPLGIGLAYNGGNNYLFTANPAGGSVSSFARSGGSLTLYNQLGGLSGPTGLAADPQGQYVYTGDSGDGTVAQMRINGTCGQTLCLVKTYHAESPANSNAGSGFVVMTN